MGVTPWRFKSSSRHQTNKGSLLGALFVWGREDDLPPGASRGSAASPTGRASRCGGATSYSLDCGGKLERQGISKRGSSPLLGTQSARGAWSGPTGRCGLIFSTSVPSDHYCQFAMPVGESPFCLGDRKTIYLRVAVGLPRQCVPVSTAGLYPILWVSVEWWNSGVFPGGVAAGQVVFINLNRSPTKLTDDSWNCSVKRTLPVSSLENCVRRSPPGTYRIRA